MYLQAVTTSMTPVATNVAGINSAPPKNVQATWLMLATDLKATIRSAVSHVNSSPNPAKSSPLCSVMWHLHRLINMNIIEKLKHGKFKRYQLAGENRERMTGYILEIMEKYYPSLWDRWSSRITEFFQ